MTFVFPCSECGADNAADWRQAGRAIACRACSATFLVPAPQELADAPEEQPALWRSVSSLRFRCPECRRKYSAKPAMAGKEMTCKGCGSKVFIPGADGTIPERPRRLPSTKRARSKSKKRSRRARDAAMPQKTLAVADESPDPFQSLEIKRAERMFEPEPSAENAGLVAAKDGDDRRGWGPGKILAVIIAAIVGIGSIVWAVQSGLFSPLEVADRAELAQLVEQDLALGHEMETILATIHDDSSARSAVPIIAATLDRMKTFYRENQHKSFLKTDLDDVASEFEYRRGVLKETIHEECVRIAAIPGASAAFAPLIPSAEELRTILPAEENGSSGGFRNSPMARFRLDLPPPSPSGPNAHPNPGKPSGAGATF